MKLTRFMQGGLGVAFLFFGLSGACAQGVIQQSGPATAGHGIMFVQNGIAKDAGPASGGAVGTNASEVGVTVRGTGTPPYANAGTGPLGTNICDYDAPITNATGYHYLCFSANAQGGGLIVYGAGGTAAPLGLLFSINGVTYNPISGLPAPTGVLITNVMTYTATTNFDTYAFKNPTIGTKTLNLYACNSGTAWQPVTIVDDLANSSLSGNAIVAVPAAGNTILVTLSSLAINFNNQSYTIVCDGAGNWFGK